MMTARKVALEVCRRLAVEYTDRIRCDRDDDGRPCTVFVDDVDITHLIDPTWIGDKSVEEIMWLLAWKTGETLVSMVGDDVVTHPAIAPCHRVRASA